MRDRNDGIEAVQAKHPHIVTFIKKVRDQYGEKILDHHFYRQSVVYICRMFNALYARQIRSIIQGQSRAIRSDVQTALELRANNHSGFMEIYNPLLQLYIDSTREFLENRRNGVHLRLSEYQKFHKN